MILSHRHRFIFFCNGRTGTSSIEKALGPLDEGRDYAFRALGLFVDKHVPPALLRGCLPEAVWSGYFKLVFVRNPFDWFVSQWKHNFRLRPPRPGQAFSAPWVRVSRGGEILYMGRPMQELAAKEAFDARDVDFLHEFLRRYHRVLPHAPASLQSSYVLDADGGRAVDFVGRFERLREDFAAVLQRLELKLELPHLNRTSHRPYPGYFSAGSAARVAKLWAADFEILGYSTTLGAQGAGAPP